MTNLNPFQIFIQLKQKKILLKMYFTRFDNSKDLKKQNKII